jgi:predicted metal-dependent enzyme (double-stranded beta helix superfamily)
MTRPVFDTFLVACRAAMNGPDPMDGVRSALGALGATPDAALAEVPAFDGDDYTLLHQPDLSVFIVRQDPLTAGPPHDHGMTAAIVMLDGVEIHHRYKRDGDAITPTARPIWNRVRC